MALLARPRRSHGPRQSVSVYRHRTAFRVRPRFVCGRCIDVGKANIRRRSRLAMRATRSVAPTGSLRARGETGRLGLLWGR
jgi:hypothetical protein